MNFPRRTAAALALVLLLAPSLLSARQDPAPVRQVVAEFLAGQTAGLAGEIRTEVGELDPNNHLPPCERFSAFLPSGQRAWGQTTVGVSCQAPATWTAYVPARVRVLGDYLVLARPLRSGQVVGPDDLEWRRGDLADDGDGALTDATQAVGHPARIAVSAGQPLTRHMLRLPPVVKRGQAVRVVTVGEGFRVSNEGKAMNNAGAGESVRVRLNRGRVVTGVARPDGSVEVSP
ncbi:MAG: flagellar basal body P-ring formation protein FlgA [Rhodocyclaceae bacterium]|nr:flagellar basal body P-ring formation protein FlgA [Rhodocyclaceae bacterium]